MQLQFESLYQFYQNSWLKFYNASASHRLPATLPLASICGTPMKLAVLLVSTVMLANGLFAHPSASNVSVETATKPAITAQNVQGTASLLVPLIWWAAAMEFTTVEKQSARHVTPELLGTRIWCKTPNFSTTRWKNVWSLKPEINPSDHTKHLPLDSIPLNQ